MTIALNWAWVSYFSFILCAGSPFAYADVLAEPDALLSAKFPGAEIENVNVLLTTNQAEKIKKRIAQSFDDRVFTFFVAKTSGKEIGYAGLYTRKVRSKDQTALYFIDLSGALKSIDLVAFYEPIEYKPKEKWLRKFKGKSDPNRLKLGGEIQVVSGATLTAQSFMSAAKLILAVWQERFASAANPK